ncbi:MAG: MTAP family purine nucleoside phosphorylase [Bacteroidales bacterium]|nr:MAG: MTAP family purine nucleoside phosphorylase [Bacteroidales bacterium]
MNKIAIIGGTGLENIKFLEKAKETKVETPYGNPSPGIETGNYNGLEIVHLSRHGKKHSISSTNVNYRANLYALKQLGCSHILSTTACGSLQEEICPGELVVLDQFIDLTKHIVTTINEEAKPGELKYTPMANPFSGELRDHLIEAAVVLGLTIHTKGTVITIEGHRFSTRAESNLYRAWGADVINMSTAPEAILANELGIPYAAIAVCTDYDSWRTDIKPPATEEMLGILNSSAGKMIELIKKALTRL